MDEDMLTSGLKERAKLLFFLSDEESKGFIVRRDMQRMGSEVPLPPEQLEAVFDSLDREHNGFLTLQQFLQGFGSFLSSGAPSSKPEVLDSSTEFHDDQCQILMEELSSCPTLHTPPLRNLCDVIAREGSPQMQLDLEAVLRQLEDDVRRMEKEQRGVQEAARTREELHDKQVRKLFEEMEANLLEEKLQVASQFESRLSQLKRKMEEEISQREQALQEVTSQRDESAKKLQLALASAAEEQRTAARLRQDKEELATCCEQQASELKRLRTDTNGYRTRDLKTEGENRTHMAAGFKLAQTIFRQEQGLLEQLRILNTLVSTLEEAKQTTTDGNDKQEGLKLKEQI